jgi:hypothetical protein
MNTLPDDIARCTGAGLEGEMREECETCLRRTEPRIGEVQWMLPPPIVAFECEYLIEPE